MKSVPSDTGVVVHVVEAPTEWRVYWPGIWVGTLAALATALIIGLAGIAIGAHHIVPNDRILRWSDVGPGALIFTVLGSFFAFVVGGWAAAKIAGTHRAESSALHGSIVWLLAVPMLVLFAAIGVGGFFGGWYSGLSGMPFWVTPPSAATVDPNAAIASRNAALGALTSLLIGLVGSVLGGWMASGEPMSMTYRRVTEDTYDDVHDINMRRTA